LIASRPDDNDAAIRETILRYVDELIDALP